MKDIRKTVRFSQKEIDLIMNNDDLREYGRWGGYNDNTSFSVRIREMIKRYQSKTTRINFLVEKNNQLSDKCARLSDKLDIQTSDNGYPKEESS